MGKYVLLFFVCFIALGTLGYMQGQEARYSPDRVLNKVVKDINLDTADGGYFIRLGAGEKRWSWDVQGNRQCFDDALLELKLKKGVSFPVSTSSFSDWVEPEYVFGGGGLSAVLLYLRGKKDPGANGWYYLSVTMGSLLGYTISYFLTKRLEPDPGSTMFQKVLTDSASIAYLERAVFMDQKQQRGADFARLLDSLESAGNPSAAKQIKVLLDGSIMRARFKMDLVNDDFRLLLQPLAFVSGPGAPMGAGVSRGVISAGAMKTLQGSGILP